MNGKVGWLVGWCETRNDKPTRSASSCIWWHDDNERKCILTQLMRPRIQMPESIRLMQWITSTSEIRWKTKKKKWRKKTRSKYWYSNNDVFHVCANGTFWSNIFNWLNVSSILNPASWLTGNPIQFEQIYWKVEPMFWNNFVQSNLTTHCWNDTSNSKYLKKRKVYAKKKWTAFKIRKKSYYDIFFF